MTKNKKLIIASLVMIAGAVIYIFYLYSKHYGFDQQINPMILLLGMMVCIGVFGVVGNYLNHKEISKAVGDHNEENELTTTTDHFPLKDREIQERLDEEHDDTHR